METGLHAVQDCLEVRQIWCQLLPQARWNELFGEQSCTMWVDGNINGRLGSDFLEHDWTPVFWEAVNSFWFWKNKAFHNSKDEVPND